MPKVRPNFSVRPNNPSYLGSWVLAVVALLLPSLSAWGQAPRSETPFGVGLETGGVRFSRNDVRIPGDTGTRFDMMDLTGSGPELFARLHGHWDINARHGLRVVLGPLEVSGTGELDQATDFAGETFPAGTTDGTFKFNAYKFTYRYTFDDRGAWRWRVGFTAVIRDANVELRQGSLQANDDNVGFVPALHLSGDYRFANRWRFRLDFDGLAGGPGRLIDLGLLLDYELNDSWRVGGGYRALEGGVDTDDVYNFAWLHYAVLSVHYRF
jgi:hypothetical protein